MTLIFGFANSEVFRNMSWATSTGVVSNTFVYETDLFYYCLSHVSLNL